MSREERVAALEERVAALSAPQREALARALARGRGRPDQLVAFVAGSDGTPSPEELDAFLAERLPAYMVPTRYVAVDRLPRTPSGKLDRRGAAERAGTELAPKAGGIVRPRDPVEERLAEIWREVLDLDEVSVHDDFFEIGGDSLLSIRVISRAAKAGLGVTPEVFFDRPTIASLAAAIAGGGAAAEQRVVTGRAPLTPIQHWFFERITRDRSRWNQSFLLRPLAEVGADAVTEAVAALVAHHDGLRLRFVRDEDGGWAQDFAPVPDRPPVRRVDLSGVPEPERPARIAEEADAEHASLDLEQGSLLRVVLFTDGARLARLLLLAHHALVDAVSWGVLIEDLSALCSSAEDGAPAALPPKTASALAWAEALVAAAARPEYRDAAAHWTGAPPDAWTGPSAAVEDNRVADADRVLLDVDAAETDRVLSAADRLGAGVEDLLLGAFLVALRSWSGRARIQLDVEGHGRDAVGDLDGSRTVGWFTTVFPLTVELDEATPAAAVRAAREALSALPKGRATHGIVRHLHPDAALRARLAELPRSTVLFNYLGSVDELLGPDASFAWAPEPTGAPRSPAAARAYVLEVNTAIRAGRITVELEYPRDVLAREEIEGLASATHEALRALLDEPARSAGYARSGLDDEGLARVADLLARADGA